MSNLVLIEIGHGRAIQLEEDEARRRGLWPPSPDPVSVEQPPAEPVKAEKPTRNKKRSPERTKAVDHG